MFRGAFLLAAFAVAQPALAQKVMVETDGSFNFREHVRYMWRDHPLAAKDPVMQQATVAAELIRSAVNDKLMHMGFQPVDGDPDFFVTYFVTGHIVEDVRLISTIGPTYWYGWSPLYYQGWGEYEVEQKLKGALVLDLVDARSLELVWRAFCRDTIKDMATRHKNIERAIDKALKKLPSPAK